MSSVIEYERGGADQFQQEGIPNHTGEPRAKPADFFAPPPPEIGQVLTAESSLAPVGTNYDYRWSDAAGRLLYRLNGTYRAGRKKLPKQGSAYNFALAAEMAWSNHFLSRAQAHLESEGSIPFRIDAHKVVRVGPGFLEFHFGEQPQRVTKEEIASVSLGNGQFSFKHKDARWFSRSAGPASTRSPTDAWPTAASSCSRWTS